MMQARLLFFILSWDSFRQHSLTEFTYLLVFCLILFLVSVLLPQGNILMKRTTKQIDTTRAEIPPLALFRTRKEMQEMKIKIQIEMKSDNFWAFWLIPKSLSPMKPTIKKARPVKNTNIKKKTVNPLISIITTYFLLFHLFIQWIAC